jgi:hypothetical protein
MAFPRFHLRKNLYLIGQNMSMDDVKSLKFLCAYHDIPRRQLDRIKTAFELFCALESKGKIDYGDDKVLGDLLKALNKQHLLKKFPINVQEEDLFTDHGGSTCPTESYQNLMPFLNHISDCLSDQDFRTLACFLFDPQQNAACYSFQDIEGMTSAQDIFIKLLNAKIIGPTNLTALTQVFEVIGRNDLKQKIYEFLPKNSLNQRKPLSLPLSSYSPPSLPSVQSSVPSSFNSEMVSNPPPFIGQTPSDLSGGYASIDHGSKDVPFAQISPGRPAVIPSAPPSIVSYNVSPPAQSFPPQRDISQPTPTTDHVHHAMYHGNPPPTFIPGISPEQESYRQEGLSSHFQQIQAENEELKRITTDQLKQIEQLHQENLLKRQIEEQCMMNQGSSVPGYNMSDRRPRGLALVIGNETFQQNPNRNVRLESRKGCQADVHNFTSCFGYLGYRVQTHTNLSSHQLFKLMEDMANIDHTHFDSFVFCISSHGENNRVFGSDTMSISVYDLVSKMQKCPTLIGKPKLFFIQACRTPSSDDHATVNRDGDPPAHIPNNPEADTAIFWATTRQNAAFRSSRDGSWFVVSLYKVFTENSHRMDLVSMMYLVTDTVAKMEGKDRMSQEIARQCVETSLQLRGIIRFNLPTEMP